MNSLTSFFDSDFNTQQEQWEKSLAAELKLPDINQKISKKMLTGNRWPTLSLERKAEVHMSSSSWKKASTTYAYLDSTHIEASLNEDLDSGVRNFFFHEEALTQDKWKTIESTLKKAQDLKDIEVFLLGKMIYESSTVKVISNLITGALAHDQGGHTAQELGIMARNLVEDPKTSNELFLGVYVDSLFFHNIAKLRAARLLGEKILQEAGVKKKLKVVALTSYQGWSLYERYSNMLRNETAVASGYIGGADHIQSAGYNTLFELETQDVQIEHLERSQRMARNTAHVLSLESLLGVVQDSAFGSYHLENLTQYLCEEAWKNMQRLLKGEDLSQEIFQVREERLFMMKTRKTIMSGINDYPDVKEELRTELKEVPFFRRARIFEELRLRMEKVKKPEVYIALYGEYGSLNGRLNFVKNYFELLGIMVHDPGHSEEDLESFKKNLSTRNEDIIVLCAKDETYPELSDALQVIKTPHKYLAGKFEMNNFKNLYMGQNVYDVLNELVITFEGRK